MRRAEVPPPFTYLDLIVGLLDPEHCPAARYLRLAADNLPQLIADGQDAGAPLCRTALELAVGRVAADGDPGYAAACAKYDTWMATAPSEISDPADQMMVERISAAFALGAALGVRLGGAR